MAKRPEPELAITPDLVRTMLRAQFPELAPLAIRPLSRGWDNTNFRLGDDHLVRVPHRAVAAELIVSEQRWLPQLAGMIELPIPAPTHAGVPTADFPWPWSVTPWFDGDEAAGATLREPAQSAELLGEFFCQLHVSAPSDAPLNPYRGCPLADRASAFGANLDKLASSYDKDAIGAVFDHACAQAPSTQRVWLHGDMHTRNMVVRDGKLSAIIDWGDICAGDRATDLAGAFMLVPNHLDIVTDLAQATAGDWARARGWAVNFAVIYLAHSDDDPVMGKIGSQLLDTLLTS